MKKRQIIELLIIVVFGLTPLLWFQGGQIILGHDAGLTLSPISHFLDRLYAWTERFGFGNDQTYAMPGFFIHGLEALVAFLGFNLQFVQKIVFIFWFLLPGLTMYYFSSKIGKKLSLKYFALPVSILYMFNHFLLQGWFVAERTKFSVYAALPLIMVFLFDWEENKRSTFRTGLFISLTIFILNGEASLPLFGGLILSIGVFILFYLLKEFSWLSVRAIGKLFGITVLISAPLNAYWLLPYGNFVLQAYSSQVAQAGGLGGVLNWIEYVSKNSSLLNIFRLQGIPEWYLNSLHPYSSFFLNNPIVIIASFIFPVGAFISLYLIKDSQKREKILFFAFLALLTMIFMAGSHPPFGAFYVFLVNFIPGFAAFRNPFYKFAPALWFSYSILIGFTVNYLLNRLQESKFFSRLSFSKSLLVNFIYCLVSLFIILYSFPFLNGSFFDYMQGVRSTRINVPQYVFDFGKWSDSSARINTKVLSLPPPNFENNVDAYTWGYWSLSPISSLLTNAPIVNYSNYMSPSEKVLLETLYDMMKHNDSGWKNLARILKIQSFLLRKDFAWNSKGSPTEPPLIYKKTLQDSELVLEKQFGEWEVYNFKHFDEGNVKVSNKINYLDGLVGDLGKIASLPSFNPDEPIYVSSTISENSEEVLRLRDKMFLAPNCISCNLEHSFVNIDLYIPLITRDSMLYPLVQFKNERTVEKLTSNLEKVNHYLFQSLISVLAFDKFMSLNKDQGLLVDSMIDYGKALDDLNMTILDYFSEPKSIDNNLLVKVSDVLRIEKIIILKNSNNISDKEVSDLLNVKYDFLMDIKEKVDSNIWRTTDEVNKKFLISSNLDMEFDFFYKPNLSNSQQPNEINFTLNEKAYRVKSTPISANWLSLGKISLSKGQNKLSIEYPLDNLFIGPFSPKLTSSGDFSCFSSNVIAGLKNDIFKFSFEHRRLSGSKKFFAKILPGDIKPSHLMVGDILNSNSVWDFYSVDYALKNDGEFSLVICNSPTADKESYDSIIELKNVNIRKIAIPDVVFYNALDIKEQSQAEVHKNSQTQYSLKKGKESVVVLNQSFNKNWALTNSNNSVKFTANGYANGWIVNDNKSDITIKYSFQDLVNLGTIVSGVSFLSIVFYLLLQLRKK